MDISKLGIICDKYKKNKFLSVLKERGFNAEFSKDGSQPDLHLIVVSVEYNNRVELENSVKKLRSVLAELEVGIKQSN